MKGLDHALPLNHLVDHAGLLSAQFRLRAEQEIAMLTNITRHKEAERGNQHHREGDAPTHREHEEQCPHNGQNTGKKLGEAHQQTVRKLIRIRNHAALNLARRVRIQIAERQTLNLSKRLVSEVPHHGVGQTVIAEIHEPLKQAHAGRRRGNLNHHRANTREIHAARPYHAVHRLTRETRREQGQHHHKKRKQQGGRQPKPEASYVAQHLFYRAPLQITPFLCFHSGLLRKLGVVDLLIHFIVP